MQTTTVQLSPFNPEVAAKEGRTVMMACGKMADIVHFNPDAAPMHAVLGYDEDGRARMWDDQGTTTTVGGQILGMLPKLDARKLFICVYPESSRDSVHDTHEDALMCKEKDCLQILTVDYVAQLP